LSEQDAYPRGIIFATAIGSGVLLALAMHMIGTKLGFGLVNLWNTGPGVVVPATTAIAWWLIAVVGFAGGYGTGMLMDQSRSHRVPLLLRRILIAGFVIILAGAGLASSGSPSSPGFANVLAGLSALVLGTGMSFCGVHFATRGTAT